MSPPSAHLNLGPACPVLAGEVLPLEVQDRHQPGVELGAAGGRPLDPGDLGHVGLGEVPLADGTLAQPPGEIIR